MKLKLLPYKWTGLKEKKKKKKKKNTDCYMERRATLALNKQKLIFMFSAKYLRNKQTFMEILKLLTEDGDFNAVE